MPRPVSFRFWSSQAQSATLSHYPDPLFRDGYEGPAAGPFTDSEAARFLAQATFGPTDADIAHLRSVGCERGQGFLFARPQPPETMATMLASGTTSTCASRAA